MKEVLRTADPVELSAAEATLRGAGIEPFVMDDQMSSMYPATMGLLAKRLMVIDEDAHEADALIAALAEARAQDLE